jgi:large subunit ribosomal protein L13
VATEEREAMRTYSPSAKEIERAWFVVDAEGQSLGRLATRIAAVLRGKHKPTFVPHLDVGDFVVVVNAEKVTLKGSKLEQKRYHRHSGYPGGLTSVPFLTMLDKKPTEVVERAVFGMLPKNKLGRAMGKKLKVYAGPTHPHEAQAPQPLPDHL